MKANSINLWQTNVGSHMWDMAHEKSDVDVFECYMANPTALLRGIANVKSKSHSDKDPNYDYAIHEIGKVITEVLRGNVNFYWGITSPIILNDSKHLQEIRRMTMNQPCANVYHSIAGLAHHNWYKYIVKDKNYTTTAEIMANLNPKRLPDEKFHKKLRIISRTVDFGIRLLRDGEFAYKKVDEILDPLDVLVSMNVLDEAFKTSKLPREPNEEGYRNYLQRIRVERLLEELYGRREDRPDAD